MRRMSDIVGQQVSLLPVAVWRVVTNLGTIIIMGHSSLIVPPVSRPPPSLTYFNSAASVMSWATLAAVTGILTWDGVFEYI